MQTNIQTSIITRVKQWLENVVIGLNFCPFAKKEFDRQSIRYLLDSSKKPSDSLTILIEELSLLDNDQSIETTLIIYPSAYSSFDDYLDWLTLATTLIEQSGYRGVYQLASFHPDYCFEGEEQDDPANYTNRSPYPIIHILREASLDRITKNITDPDAIPNRNIAKARELGIPKLKSLMQ